MKKLLFLSVSVLFCFSFAQADAHLPAFALNLVARCQVKSCKEMGTIGLDLCSGSGGGWSHGLLKIYTEGDQLGKLNNVRYYVGVDLFTLPEYEFMDEIYSEAKVKKVNGTVEVSSPDDPKGDGFRNFKFSYQTDRKKPGGTGSGEVQLSEDWNDYVILELEDCYQ